MNEFYNFSQEEIVFPTNNCQKTVVFLTFQKNQSEIRKTGRVYFWSTTFTSYVKISANCNIKPRRRQFYHFGLGPLVSLMCGGVYAYKKVLAHLARKLKASSTNWLISIISPTPWLANILSRKINSSDQYPLKGVLVAF